jgi:hypothetical protein
MATVSAPPTPFYVKAISAYTARNNTEMSLEVGKVYHVCHTDGRGLWWQSKSEETGAVGWFPASYTQVIESPAPAQTPAPAYQAPAGVEAQPQQTQATPAATQPQASQPLVQSNQLSVVPSERGTPVKVSPELVYYGQKVVPPSACTITLHVLEAKDLTGVPPAKMTPTVYIYRRDVTERDFKKIKPLFTAQSKTKTNAPKWNEEFKLYIRDCEMEIVGLRFAAKADFKAKGKELIGDLEFPLRAAVRKFDKPNGIFQWFPIKNPEKGDKTGEVLLFVEYADPRSFGGPTNVEHKGHVGITQGGGFEIRDIPQEWKQLFRVLNIKKKDLENNPQMAQEVFDIMKNADITNINQTASEPATNNNYTPAATPQVAYTPQPPQQESTHAAVAPPPVPSGGGPKPPPPPPSGGGPRPPPPPATISPKPPTPPAAETQSSLPPSNGGGSGSIFDQLKNVKLKKAEVNEAERGAASTGNALADTLLTAMSKYRVDIAGKDDDGDDWSE